MLKKIIHLDLDYFFCQVELLTKPELRERPVAIGYDCPRSVLCTANYVARKFGVGSAMPVAIAKRKCPDLIILEPTSGLYKEYSQEIFEIFYQYTDLVEGLSLDEAFLDVTMSERFFNSATLIAKDIRQKIFHTTGLTLSAGVSSNKLISKMASSYKKPDALTVVVPSSIDDFIKNQSVKKIWGVGEVTFNKLKKMNIHTFSDLREVPLETLKKCFGIFGEKLFYFSRGIDEREVNTSRARKSLSVERTFYQDIYHPEELLFELKNIYDKFLVRLERYKAREKKSLFVKIKYKDFEQTTCEQILTQELKFDLFKELFWKRFEKETKGIRLLGLGVKFKDEDVDKEQLSFNLAC